MKITVNMESSTKVKPFPKLMISKKNTIVLFEDNGLGTCVATGGSLNPLGVFANDWDMTMFEDFNGSVCLENDK